MTVENSPAGSKVPMSQEVLTLLVKSRRFISSTMEVRITKGINSAGLAFER
jgi:hypothetical protein